MWIAVVAMVIGSVIVGGVGLRAKQGTLPRNYLVGIRVPKTLSDDQAWRVVHEAAGPTLIATGMITGALSIVAGVIGSRGHEATAAAFLLFSSVVMVAGVLWAARRGLKATD